MEIGRFASGEIYVRFLESVRGCDAYVIQAHGRPVNEMIMEQLVMIDALKRASASRINAVIPYFAYARQDQKALAREPISARLVADLLSVAGCDRVMAVDLHTGQIQGFFNVPLDHLTALPALAECVRAKAGTTLLSWRRIQAEARWHRSTLPTSTATSLSCKRPVGRTGATSPSRWV